ncbi:TetR/AcrR family transcriptional regulator [Nocardia inohanensis]|uniref:TetR/AcrR family transcriptional regulator n=1 Tax=Nocardia inohanensis TaxID=209246 RepID=UPI000834E3F9|nr:TetR/AcrR family transcriptional regulator [Nocardia inohanensis]
MARTLGADQAGHLARERILRAALELFAERGYAGTSIAAVAKRAGLSAPGVLHHFGDKRALLIAVLESGEQHDRDRDEPEGYGDRTVAEALEYMVRTAERNLSNREVIRLEHVCALTPGDSAEVASEWARTRLARMRTDIVLLGVRAKERGELSADVDIEHLASLVTAAFVGLEHQWLADENFDMVGGMRAFARMLAVDLGLPEAPGLR